MAIILDDSLNLLTILGTVSNLGKVFLNFLYFLFVSWLLVQAFESSEAIFSNLIRIFATAHEEMLWRWFLALRLLQSQVFVLFTYFISVGDCRLICFEDMQIFVGFCFFEKKRAFLLSLQACLRLLWNPWFSLWTLFGWCCYLFQSLLWLFGDSWLSGLLCNSIRGLDLTG